jgi:hypothetical protein
MVEVAETVNPSTMNPDYPQDEQPGPGSPGKDSRVPSLIHDYRAQREAWREQARNLARMREEVLTAADHEARGIVSAARADVRRILLKARRDLLVLAAQVRAAGRLGDGGEETVDTFNLLPSDDLGQARNALTTARHDIRRVLDESRPELEGLASEGDALRAALHHHRPGAPAPEDVRRRAATLPIQDIPQESAIDFDFTTIGADESPEFAVRHPQRTIRALVAAAASLGALALMGTGLWMFWPSGTDTPAVETAATPAKSGAAPAAVRTAGTTSVGERKSPLSIRLATRQMSWVRITADGQVAAERIFKPGETQNVRASREITVRAGDAGAVTVAVDGRQPIALGREGEVVTRRFAVETPRAARTTPPPAAGPSVRAAPAPAQRPATVLSTTPRAVATTLPAPRVTEQPPVTAPPSVAPANPPASTQLSARPAAASVERPPLAPAATTQASLQDALTRDASRWLDAYYRQDRATMASISPQATVSDQRAEKERLPVGLNGVRRSLDEVRVQVAGSEVLLTARMTERMENAAAGQMAQAVSFVSQMWTQRNGSWQLMDVRLMSAAAIAQSLRR